MPRASPIVARLAEALLRQAWPSQTALAEAVGLTPGALHPWIQNLLFYRAINIGDNGIEAQRDQVFRYFTSHRIAALRAAGGVTSQMDIEGVAHALQDRGIEHVFAFHTAANHWAFFERRHEIQVYVPPRMAAEARRIFGGRLALSRATSYVRFFEEPLMGLARMERAGLPITDPMQTILDLRAHPEGGAHADFLETNLLPRWLERPR